MTEPLRILIADDHTLFRRGVAELINEDDSFALIGEATDGEEAFEMASSLQPDVILMDVHMPNVGGVEAVRRIKSEDLGRVLMLTVSEKDEDLLAAIDAGADGYLLKNAEPGALFEAIRQVAKGRSVLSPEVTGAVMQRVSRPVGDGDATMLTPREFQVLRRLAGGDTTAKIALDLGIQSSTVKTHIHNILRKTGSANRAEAVAKAASMGLLDET